MAAGDDSFKPPRAAARPMDDAFSGSEADRVDRLERPDGPVPVVLDTDAYNEVDDQFALAWAVGALDLRAVYAAPFDNERSSGPGDGMEESYREIERVLDRLDGGPADGVLASEASEGSPRAERRDGVYRGSERFLPEPDEPVESPAATDLVARAGSVDGPLYVLAVGAPTNVASAVLAEPAVVDEVVVVWLGGQPHAWHTAREFNLRQDRHATRVLFDSGVPLVQVPCRNVAEHLRTTVPELEAHLAGRGALADFLVDRVREYRPTPEGDGADGWYSKVIWDLAAVAYLAEPEAVTTHLTHSPTLSDDLTYGRSPSRHLMRVADWVDRDAIFQSFAASLPGT